MNTQAIYFDAELTQISLELHYQLSSYEPCPLSVEEHDPLLCSVWTRVWSQISHIIY